MAIKRFYDAPEDSDGKRILVDRLWPRGVAKAKARIDEWLKEIAPSNQLRQWYGHKSERWKEFQKCYREELRPVEKQELLKHLKSLARRGTVTLLFTTKETERNNAVALANLLKQNKSEGNDAWTAHKRSRRGRESHWKNY